MYTTLVLPAVLYALEASELDMSENSSEGDISAEVE